MVVYGEGFRTEAGKKGVNAVLTTFESRLFHSNGLIRLHTPISKLCSRMPIQ